MPRRVIPVRQVATQIQHVPVDGGMDQDTIGFRSPSKCSAPGNLHGFVQVGENGEALHRINLRRLVRARRKRGSGLKGALGQMVMTPVDGLPVDVSTAEGDLRMIFDQPLDRPSAAAPNIENPCSSIHLSPLRAGPSMRPAHFRPVRTKRSLEIDSLTRKRSIAGGRSWMPVRQSAHWHRTRTSERYRVW